MRSQDRQTTDIPNNDILNESPTASESIATVGGLRRQHKRKALVINLETNIGLSGRRNFQRIPQKFRLDQMPLLELKMLILKLRSTCDISTSRK